MAAANRITGEHIDRRWRPALMSFFLRRVRNHAEAEDLTQEVLIRLLNAPEGGVERDSYIFQIAQNLLIDRSRKAIVRDRYRVDAMADHDRGVEAVNPQMIAEGRDEMDRFLVALAELPERTRTMFVLYRIEKLSQDMIAERYGISASAVKQQIAKAMAFLMARLRNS